MLKSWIAKAFVQKLISFLPFKYRTNFFFQKHITRGVELTDLYFNDRLIHARNHLKYYTELTGSKIPSKTLELGTGWYPVIPIYFFLKGVNSIYTIDISRHIKRNFSQLTIKMFLNDIQNGLLSAEKEGFIPERIEKLKGISESKEDQNRNILNEIGIVQVVKDVRVNSFSDEYFDLIHSNNTFEHINPKELKQILLEFLRIMKRGGAMSHFIDMTDHFAHFDKSITVYNFLKYSAKQWRIIDNSIQPQNRLRVKDYKDLYNELGIDFRITEIREGSVVDLERVKLHGYYSSYSPIDMAMSHCQFISQKQ